jgi:hypothetical protein
VAKVRKRLAVNKQRSHIFQMESSNLKKLKEVECKKQYRVKISIGEKARGKRPQGRQKVGG